ncbi:phytanoyl-CoA dioxygenase [Nakamurella antarctica]|uniref:Phytanoyl-CoA dioxygenase n=1 Tax=Nakamurella antarctica TaxID=1902245 RepID=A0A3G8ZSS4_9ACTN|nr:phytanoyl-CoA dioxygenase family protein [Nakamurella antarctica]AZI56841.1 phytanoyl-CoA dioxygenase [Nakamurella antarctica]
MITSNGYTLDEAPARLGALQPVPDSERGDKDALWSRMRRDGYLYLKNQIDPELVRAFREYYFTKMAETGLVERGSDMREAVGTQVAIDRALLRSILFGDIVPGSEYESLTSHPSIKGWFEWFLGDDVHLHKRKIIRHTRPGEAGIGTATQAHYDLVYLRGGTDKVLAMWIPLGDCPVDMGGLTYLEGSHHPVMADERNGVLRAAEWITADLPKLAEKYDSRWLVADYEAGDVVVHSSHIIHAGTDNVDSQDRLRLSTDIRYQRASEPIDWRWQEHWHDQDGL